MGIEVALVVLAVAGAVAGLASWLVLRTLDLRSKPTWIAATVGGWVAIVVVPVLLDWHFLLSDLPVLVIQTGISLSVGIGLVFFVRAILLRFRGNPNSN